MTIHRNPFFNLLLLSLICCMQAGGAIYSKDTLLMGSDFSVTAMAEEDGLAKKAVTAAIQEMIRIEEMISSWDKRSETHRINMNAGIQPVKVSKELFDLIYRSNKVAIITDGVFDISFSSIGKLWKYDGTMKELPTEAEISNSVAMINYKDIILDAKNTSVFLRNEGMKIGFGAIGKGYAANKAKAVMVEMGIKNGIVNAGGDLLCWGHNQEKKDWKIGIADPQNKGAINSWLNISNMAVVTSGNYERYVEINGIRYGHIIDPKTGYPAQGTKSVTIICPDAELADALATAVFILGEINGLALVNQLKEVECIIITDKDEMIFSKNLTLKYYQ